MWIRTLLWSTRGNRGEVTMDPVQYYATLLALIVTMQPGPRREQYEREAMARMAECLASPRVSQVRSS